jgi:hypothetical protein
MNEGIKAKIRVCLPFLLMAITWATAIMYLYLRGFLGEP